MNEVSEALALVFSNRQADAKTMIASVCGSAFVRFFQPRPITLSSAHHYASALASAQSPPAGQSNLQIAVADSDGEGILDNASVVPSGIRVTLKNEDGTQLSASSYRISVLSPSIVAADFNSEGKMDLAVAQNDNDTSGPGNVVVLLGNRDGTFVLSSKFSAGPVAYCLETGDFNGDGVPDLAVATQPAFTFGARTVPGTVAVLLGKGDGTFASPFTYPVGVYPQTIVAADFNGDGKTDLAVLDSTALSTRMNQVWVLLGRGDGTFQPAIPTPTATSNGYLQFGDLNRDGKLDPIIADKAAGAMAILMGNGEGSFQPSNSYAIGVQPISIAVLPLNDGNTSFFAADNLSKNLNFFFASADGAVHSPLIQKLGKTPASLVAVDLNKDGQPHLIVTDPGAQSLYIKLGASQGKFSAPAVYPIGSDARDLATADINLDGKPDAIVADGAGINILLGKGDGTFAPSIIYMAGGKLLTPAVADFNSDGKSDVATANQRTGAISLFLGNGDGSFQSARTIPPHAGAFMWAKAAGDFNGDGKPDLMAAFSPADLNQPGSLAVLLGNGDRTFQAPVIIPLPGKLFGATLTLGDVNGDGKLDAKCCGLAEASYLLGNGDGTFQPEVKIPSGGDPGRIAVADFNGHGRPDAAILGLGRSTGYGTLTVMFNAFQNATPQPAP